VKTYLEKYIFIEGFYLISVNKIPNTILKYSLLYSRQYVFTCGEKNVFLLCSPPIAFYQLKLHIGAGAIDQWKSRFHPMNQ
jgi:hypothetical protein